jgi:hypothetical protein
LQDPEPDPELEVMDPELDIINGSGTFCRSSQCSKLRGKWDPDPKKKVVSDPQHW